MTKRQFVSDTTAVIALQGLRTVTKSDSHYSNGKDAFWLELEYKGLHQRIEYADQKERDDTFFKIKAALDPLVEAK